MMVTVTKSSSHTEKLLYFPPNKAHPDLANVLQVNSAGFEQVSPLYEHDVWGLGEMHHVCGTSCSCSICSFHLAIPISPGHIFKISFVAKLYLKTF